MWSLTMVKSGLRYSYGVGFWGPNGHDGVWHLSLVRAMAGGSFEMPIFAGETIKNYHLGFDLLLVFFHKITAIPVSVLYFQVFPPLGALLIGLLTYKFVFWWRKSRNAAVWSTFFVYFGGNAAWIIGKGESAFWAQPSVLTLVNPPYALSLIAILCGLITLRKWKFSIIFFGILIQIKAYAGVIVLGALFVSAIYEFWQKRTFNYFRILLGSTLISFFLFLPNARSSSLLEFRPFWFLETMMGFNDRLGWARYGEAMVNYRLGGAWLKAILAYGVALLVFWYGNLGARLVHEFYWVRKAWQRKIGQPEMFVGSVMVLGFLGAMLFVQKGTAWNTIQFFYYTLFFASILSGVVFAGIIEAQKNRIYRNILAIGVVAFTLPTTFLALSHYLPLRPPSMIPNDEIEVLDFLAKQTKGVVLVMPFDREAADRAIDNPPRPLYLYESTSYVSAYSGQKVWLEDEVNLDITGYNWQERRSKLVQALESGAGFRDFLDREGVDYVYVTGRTLDQGIPGLDVLYERGGVRLYGVESGTI